MKITSISIVIIFTLSIFISCNSSKNYINYEKVKEGQQLEKAQEIPLNTFVEIWMSNRKSKVDTNCHELFRNDVYTYFGKNYLKLYGLTKSLYKVQNKQLDSLFKNYRNIDAQEIKFKFWELYVPQNESKIIENSNCSSSSGNPKYSYEIQKDKLIIHLRWKARCDGKKIIDKKYTGSYDTNKLKFDIE